MDNECGESLDNVILKKPHLLLVEGKDEIGFFESFFKYLKEQNFSQWEFLEKIQIISTDGKDKLEEVLRILLKLPNIRNVNSITILQDADEDRNIRFKEIQKIFQNIKLSCPNTELSFKESKISKNFSLYFMIGVIGIDNFGMLEDLCLSSVSDDPATTCVENYFICLEKAFPQGFRFPPNHLSKSRARVFLASCQKPTIYIGLASKEGYWPFDNECFNYLRLILRNISTI
jgi:hypothetical protein